MFRHVIKIITNSFFHQQKKNQADTTTLFSVRTFNEAELADVVAVI